MQKENPTIRNSEIAKSTQINNMRFSARDDYVAYFRSHGMVQEGQDPWKNDKLVIATQRHWHTHGQNGCVFAQVAATRADDVGWDSRVLSKEGLLSEGKNVVHKIDEIFEGAINNEGNQNLSLLFPNIETPQQLVTLLKDIRDTSTKIIVHDTQLTDYTVLALRGKLGGGVLSWLVGFGPFDFLPLTRQSPITEIAIRTKKKPEIIFHKLNQDRDAAHLADIPLGLNDKLMDTLLDKTKSRTGEILAGTSRKLSSAKVSFAIPTKYWHAE